MLTRAKAPLRLGLAGGGTDISPFCDKYGGAVLNATISLYAYCIIQDRPDNQIEFHATDFQQQEIIPCESHLSIQGDLQLHRGVYNRIVQDFLKGQAYPLSVTTYCDAPPGSGLGSSSTVVVAMIQAYVDHFNLGLGEYDIAHLAYEVERVNLGLKGGKQDQYAAAFGGVNFMEFYEDNQVIVNPLRIRPDIISELEASLVLFYTGMSRDSDLIIRDQLENLDNNNQNKLNSMLQMKESAIAMKKAILKGNLSKFSEVLHESWLVKKSLSSKISNPFIDEIYGKVIEAGAIAGKVSGAGGGGFMMFMVDPVKKLNVVRILEKEQGRIVPCHFSQCGSIGWSAAKLITFS